MKARKAILVVLLASLFAPTSCAPSLTNTGKSDATIRELRNQVDDPSQFIRAEDVQVNSEPPGDVADGIFLARIQNVSGEADSRAAAIDFISPEMEPWITPEDRRRSSWPGHFGWNRTRHVQIFDLRSEPSLIVGYGIGELRPVNVEQFAKIWRSKSYLRDMNYYVDVSSGDIISIWPWSY